VSVKAAIFDDSGEIVQLSSKRIEGNLPDCLKHILNDLNQTYQSDECYIAAVTGSGISNLANLMDIEPVNEITAACTGALHLVPTAGSILSVGGTRACFIRLMDDPARGRRIIRDSFQNSRCFSGSGIFVEQEASRFNMTPDELIELALKSSHPPIISGRCTVFAKTDITHKHQDGVQLTDIAGAICQMIARNIVGELIKRTAFDVPVVFIGGVAQNKAIYKLLRRNLNLDKGSLIVPSHYLYANAIGSYRYSVSKRQPKTYYLKDAIELINDLYRFNTRTTKPLKPLEQRRGSDVCSRNSVSVPPKSADYLLGIDIGSTNTKVVCIDRSGEVLESYSTPTKGQPLEAVRESFNRMVITRNGALPAAVGVTGSGRKYISNILRADTAVNEITAHAEAGISFYPDIDTIIDIGGQDSKFIRIKDGYVTNFEMNKVCSAGTGSFLEETSSFLGLDVRTEFAGQAFKARAPLDLGDRCTVFISSELTQRQNEGYRTPDIAAGLAYSVINNYFSRVVGRHKIGRNISFQGGVAGNRAVVAALERMLNQHVFVHPYYEIAGAVGAAIIAGRETRKPSRFAGYASVKSVKPNHKSFLCHKCGNSCSVNYIQTVDHRRLYSGGVCDRYDEGNINQAADLASPTAVRLQLLERHSQKGDNDIDGDTVGLPLAMHFTELLPFWTTFLKELGAKFAVSPPTTREILQIGSEISPSSSCLPLKIAYGHCLHLHQLGVRKLLVPSISNISFNTKTERLNHICPAAQAWPYTAASLLPKDIAIIDPTVRMALPHKFKSDMIALGKSMGYRRKEISRALSVALDTQNNMYFALRSEGERIMHNSDPDKTCAIIFARPYTFSDYQIISRLQPILNDLNVAGIPFDMLSTAPLYSHELDGMYWYFGKRYLQAARRMKSLRKPIGIFISTYGCGTDTLLIHLLRDAMGDIPFLELEIDQHCDFTGLRTRLEAFFYSLGKNKQFNVNPVKRRKDSPLNLNGRRILIPQMSDHAFACASALKSFGYEAEVMPLTGEKAMRFGKNAVNGGECLPCTMLAGDMLNTLRNNDGQKPPVFFMISGDGPCRLGQYTYLLRKILDEKGYADISIIDMSQDISFYNKLDIVSSEFKKRLWKGSVAIDLLNACFRRLRPTADNKNALDQAYMEAVNNVSDCVNNNKKLTRQLQLAFAEFDRFENANGQPEATVAIVGENYIRCNPAANQQLIDKLERKNAAVYLPNLTEWIYYTNWTARLHCLYEKKYSRFCRLFLVSLFQKLYSNQLHRAVKSRLPDLKEPEVKRIFELASAYVPPAFEGETIISVGRTIDYFLKGIDGVIQVSPFGCLAGTIYETLSQRLSDDLHGLPILNLQFDGRKDDLREEELESFLILSRNWKKHRDSRP
jgi:predicted CoA-substrate-specific enzyme activase